MCVFVCVCVCEKFACLIKKAAGWQHQLCLFAGSLRVLGQHNTPLASGTPFRMINPGSQPKN